MLPMVAGMAATKRTFQNLVIEFGLASMQALFGAHAEALAGPKGKHQKGRTMNHWGSALAELPFAGRKVIVARPRVRSCDGREVQIPFIQELMGADPLSEAVIDQILLGVSTRGYACCRPAYVIGARFGRPDRSGSADVIGPGSADLIRLF